jgi:predicted oxidoreductase
MEKIYLSDSGPKVSPAIYGFWRWSDEGENTIKEMEKTVNLCLELGINTFDHADIYGKYQSEELFGKVMQQKSFKREDVVLFTKCGVNLVDPSQPSIRVKHYDTSKDHIIKSVDNSLKKLKTDYIDIFMLHHLDPLTNLEETASALMGLIGEGKIKHIGIADFSVFQHQLLASYLRKPIVANHVELNLLNTTAIDDGRIDFIKQKYGKPLAWAPLAGGRIHNGTDETAVKVRKKLEEIGKKYNANIEQTAVAWLIKIGALPIIGTLDEQRIKNAASAFSIDLDRQDWYELYAAANEKW